MKYPMLCTIAHVHTAPATVAVFHTLSGDVAAPNIPLPAIHFPIAKGQAYTARNKPERDRLLKTGNWRLA